MRFGKDCEKAVQNSKKYGVSVDETLNKSLKRYAKKLRAPQFNP